MLKAIVERCNDQFELPKSTLVYRNMATFLFPEMLVLVQLPIRTHRFIYNEGLRKKEKSTYARNSSLPILRELIRLLADVAPGWSSKDVGISWGGSFSFAFGEVGDDGLRFSNDMFSPCPMENTLSFVWRVLEIEGKREGEGRRMYIPLRKRSNM